MSMTSLCLHTLRADCSGRNAQNAYALFRTCVELVDSFSDSAKAASALTIFPCSSTVKAIYIAIIDSLGRTIDRFCCCEPHRIFMLADDSPDAHAGNRMRQF